MTPKTKEMLFILGQFFRETDRRFSSAPLRIQIPKVEFIEAIRAMGVLDKKDRAVYKNLEALQKARLISYKGRNLSLTHKGHSRYLRLCREIEHYNDILSTIKSGKISFRRKTQTRFR